jgi:hypothetical protein
MQTLVAIVGLVDVHAACAGKPCVVEAAGAARRGCKCHSVCGFDQATCHRYKQQHHQQLYSRLPPTLQALSEAAPLRDKHLLVTRDYLTLPGIHLISHTLATVRCIRVSQGPLPCMPWCLSLSH